MSSSSKASATAAPRGFRRVAPAFVLFFLSPFVAEFLLGNISISAIAALVFLAPMYGGGALAVREIARRCGRGWATIILLALAYGLIEEGVSIQTLFNPNYLGLHLLAEANLPSLGMGGWWTPFVLTLHTVWSISVPIVITEALFAERRETPWLGKTGIAVSILLLLVGGVVIHFGTNKQDPFRASPLQLISTIIVIVVVGALAFRFKKRGSSPSGTAPNPWIVGITTFVLGLAFMTVHDVLGGWPVVGVYAVIYVIAIVLLTSWSRGANWSPLHTLAAGGGAMLTYACTAFPQQPVVGAKGTVDLVGNTIFALIAVVLLVRAVKSERKVTNETR
ncbi:MAG TPA: hypothetical protein VGM64_01165 [Lacunisphaera sp.]|jgi:hypothetical protein